MKILLVGGAVRDLLLGREIRDVDYLVLDATAEEFEARFPEARKVGRSFPVYLHEGVEFAFPRRNGLEGDLEARDLTINAIGLDEEGNLYAHPQALADLHDRVLRPASQTSFTEDPLRVFRTARLWAELPEFRPHPELIRAMGAAGDQGLLENLSKERVAEECLKAFAAARPGRFLKLLDSGRCLSPWFEELGHARDIPAGPKPFHHGPVLEHLCEVMDRLSGNPLRVYMGMVHDLGKTGTDPGRWPRHHGHERIGEELARRLGTRLGLPLRYIRAGAIAARHHMAGGVYSALRPGTKVDLLSTLSGADILEEFCAVIRADNGDDFLEQAKQDVSIIHSVHLKEEDRDLGPKSGEKLRTLRAQALAEWHREHTKITNRKGAER
jgi:tRNA nucleotidyltransferase (CCA-adding enzyme)